MSTTSRRRKKKLRQYRRAWLLLIGIGVLLGAAVGVVALRYVPGYRPPDRTAKIWAAQFFVKAKLGNPAVVQFSPVDETQVEDLGGESIRVLGGVEAVDASGANAGYFYTCTLVRTPNGGWLAKEIDLAGR